MHIYGYSQDGQQKRGFQSSEVEGRYNAGSGYEFITRNANFEDVAVMANDKAILEDIWFDADLYIANQEIETQIQAFDQRIVDLSVKLFEVL